MTDIKHNQLPLQPENETQPTTNGAHVPEAVVTAPEDTTTTAPEATQPWRLGRRGRIIGGVAGAVALVVGVGVGIANSQKAPTTVAVEASDEPTTGPSAEASAPAEVLPSNVGLLSYNTPPAGVDVTSYTYNGWTMWLPNKLANPEQDPELFANEVIATVAVADTVPAPERGTALGDATDPQFAIFTNAVKLLGSVGGVNNNMIDGLENTNKQFHELPQVVRNPQVIYQEAWWAAADTKVTVDPVAKTVSFTSDTTGDSGVTWAADGFDSITQGEPWGGSADIKTEANKSIIPQQELPQLVIGYTIDSAGNTIVTKIDTGSATVNGSTTAND